MILPELIVSDVEIGSNRHPLYLEVLMLVPVEGSNAFSIVVGVERVRRYRLQVSSDLVTWFDAGEEKRAGGTLLQIAVSDAVAGWEYFRVTEEQ